MNLQTGSKSSRRESELTVSAFHVDNSASKTGPANRGKSPWALANVAIIFILGLAVLYLRFYRLSDVPPGIQSDEGPDGVYALQVLQGEHAVFFPELGSGRDAVGVYANALSTAFLGRTLLAFHLPVALASAATVFVLFWLGQLLNGWDENPSAVTRWRGLLIGGVGAGLMAVSITQTFQSRAGLRATYLPLFLSLSLALLWVGWRKRNITLIALSGLCTGILPYTYNAARIAPLFYLVFGWSFLIPYGRSAKEKVRQALPYVAVFLGAAALVASPLLIYFVANPEDLFIRSRGVWLFRENRGDSLEIFLKNVLEYLLAFGFQGDLLPRYNFAGRPILNVPESLFFWTGVAMAVWRWRERPAYRLLLLWLMVFLLPAMLTADDGYGPNSLRIIGASPAIYLLIGTGLWEFLNLLRRQRSSLQRLHSKLSIQTKTYAAITVPLVIGGWILFQGVLTYRTFFHKWAGTPEYYRAYQTEWTDAANALNAQLSKEGTVYVLPYPANTEHFQNAHFGFDYLYQGQAPAIVIAAMTPHNLAQKVQAKLASEDSASTVRFVDWDNDTVGGDSLAERHAVTLLGKYGRYLQSTKYDSFQIHSFTDLSLDRPWALYDRIEPMTVNFDGGISLLGFALGQGDEQRMTRHLFNAGRERTWWIALQWQTASGMDVVFSISLRLHDIEGRVVYQNDAVLQNPTPVPTNEWIANEPVDTLHYLEFPPDLMPGEYELRLVVYDFHTLEPTVELGVWEPESTIARLQFGASD